MKGHQGVGKVIATVLVFVVLIAALGALWVFSKTSADNKTKELERKAQQMNADDSYEIEDTTDGTDASADEQTVDPTAEGTANTTEQAAAETETTPSGASVISCRGDAFNENDQSTGYVAKLQEVITAAGSTVTV